MCVFVCQVFQGMGIRVSSWSSQVGYLYQLLIFYSTCTLIYTIYIKCFPSIFHSIRFDSNFYCQIFFRKMVFFFTLSSKYLVNSFTHEYSFHLFQISFKLTFKFLKVHGNKKSEWYIHLFENVKVGTDGNNKVKS